MNRKHQPCAIQPGLPVLPDALFNLCTQPAHPAGRYGIECPDCAGEKVNYLAELIFRLALPLRFSSTGGQKLEVMEQAFLHNAYAKQQHESKPDVGCDRLKGGDKERFESG